MALEKLLALGGFLVQTAGTLREGHEKLNGTAAIILDLDLPDGNGIELLRRVRTANHPAKVLVATATTDRQMLLDVRRLDPDALLLKPLDVKQLFELLGP